MTTERQHDDERLDDLLAQARDLRPRPSEALMARIMADAEAEAPAREPAAPRGAAADPARTGRLRAWAELLGGWPALGGLAASAVLGLGLGFAQPPAVSGLLASIWGGGVSVTLGLDEDLLGALAEAGAASADG